MVVGVCRITLSLPGNSSLKGKRSVVRRVLDRTQARFNVSIAEVGALDAHQRAILGLAVISNDGRHANAMVDTIVSFIEDQGAPVFDRQTELVHLGTLADGDRWPGGDGGDDEPW
jgi:uncharacterized protein